MTATEERIPATAKVQADYLAEQLREITARRRAADGKTGTIVKVTA